MARGMNLNFLKNPLQRVATGKSLPLKQIEAIIVYGKSEQRSRVVKKVIEDCYPLSLNRQTAHILLTIIEHCDNTVRAQMLYHLRRKVRDLALSPSGNQILQLLIEKSPQQQKKEIAEAFMRNVEEDEFKVLCLHRFGTHVAAKLMEYPIAADELEERLTPYIVELASHKYGQFVVAKYIEHRNGGVGKVIDALFGSAAYNEVDIDEDGSAHDEDVEDNERLDDAIARFLSTQDESAVVAALLKHPLTPLPLKDALVAHLIEYSKDYILNTQRESAAAAKKAAYKTAGADEDEFDMPEFGSAPAAESTPASANRRGGKKDDEEEVEVETRHHFAYIAAFEYGDDEQRAELFAAIQPLLPEIVSNKFRVSIAVAAFQFAPTNEAKASVVSALFDDNEKPGKGRKSKSLVSVVTVAKDPVRTMLLRAVIELGLDLLPQQQVKDLVSNGVELAKLPTSSPVLQKLLEVSADDELKTSLFRLVAPHMSELVHHECASYFVQALLQFTNDPLRSDVVRSVLNTFKIHGDAKSGRASTKASRKKETIAIEQTQVEVQQAVGTPQGSRVLQKLLAYATDEEVAAVADVLLIHEDSGEAEDEVREKQMEARQRRIEAAAAQAQAEENGTATRISDKERREINKQREYPVEGHALLYYAVQANACYVVRALLVECRTRQLDSQRRRLMNALKPFVFELSVSPWAGRIVLDTMLKTGSAELADAMKNVVYLKTEEWLTATPEQGQQRGGGLDPTMRQTLKRNREESGNNGGAKAANTGSGSRSGASSSAGNSAAVEKPKKTKKIFKSVKK